MNKQAVRGGAGDITSPKSGVRPQDNLYLAVNSDWLKTIEIPADRSSMGSFGKIDENVEKQLMQDFADFADGKKAIPNVPNLDKAVALYKVARDFDKRNSEGAEPIKARLKQLLDLKDFADLKEKALELDKEGLPVPLFFGVEPDMKNTKVNILNNVGPSTILLDTVTYQTEAKDQLLPIYQKQTINLLEMAGLSSAEAEKYVEKALAYDARIAKVVKSSEEWADYPASYNPMSLADFAAKFKSYDIVSHIEGLVGMKPDRVIEADPGYLDHAEELFNESVFEEIKGWMLARFINNAAASLSADFRQAAFPFSQALYGQAELSSGEKQAYRLANSQFSEVVGIYYGQTYFGKDAKADVIDMIHKMIKVYEKRLSENSWLSKATRDKAIVKLQALELKIGYPEKSEEVYNRFKVDESASLYENLAENSKISQAYEYEQLPKPVDRSVWAMPGNLVNACYDPQRNDLTFPAAILQKPFYDLNQTRSENYGGIGVVIAHEISHAFDNNGSQFDEFGNMVNWWQDEDYAEFKKRIQAEIKLFDGIQYGPVKLNGKQIVSENIADQGGLTAAVHAAKGEGDASMQELFENFARVWAIKQKEEAIKSITAIDVHAPGPLRANVQSQCQEEFYKAFDVKPGDGMYLEPEKRVEIW